MPEKKYKTPNGQVVTESQLRSKYGSRFDSLISNGTFIESVDEPVVSNTNTPTADFYETPNKSIVSGSELKNKYGDKFEELISNNTFRAVKKKETAPIVAGGGISGVKSGIPNQESESNGQNGFSVLDPSTQFSSKKITTPTGAEIHFDESKIPSPLQTPTFVSDLQTRINNGISLPQDAQVLSVASGKKPEAVNAYLSGDNITGQAIDRVEFVQKNKDAIKDVILNYNQQNGKALNPDEILADPDKASSFLAQAQEDFKVQLKLSDYLASNEQRDNTVSYQDIANRKRGDQLTTVAKPNYDKIKIEKLFSDFQANSVPLIQKQISESTVANGIKNGDSIDKIYKDNARRLNPRGYANAQRALNTPTGGDSLSDKSSPGEIIGALYDSVVGVKDKDEVLNSVVGQGALEVNNALFQMAQDKAAQAHLSGDVNDYNDAQSLYKQYNPNLIKEYPALKLQMMASELSQDIARDSGNLEDSASADGAHNVGVKLFGETGEGLVNRMKQKGWFDNPDTRDFAYKLLSDRSYISDASYLGSAGNSFLQPFKDLGLSVADISGVRNVKDIISDKTKDELYPKEIQGLTEFTKGIRTVVNTTSNLAGMVAIGAATAGIGRFAGIGLSAAETAELAAEGVSNLRRAELITKASSANSTLETLSNSTSFGLPSVDTNLKDSYNFIDNDAARSLYAGMGAVINTYGGKLLDLPKISNVPVLQETFTKLSQGIADGTLARDAAQELINEGKKPYVDYLLKYGKNVTEGAAVMAYFTAGNQILKSAFGDPNTSKDDIIKNTGTAFMDGLLGMMVFGAVKTKGEIDVDKNSSFKGTLFNMSLTPDAVTDIFKLGKTSDADFNQKMQILNTSVLAKKSLDASMAERGVILEPNQQAVFVANKTIEAYIREQVKDLPEGEKKVDLLLKADKLKEQGLAALDGLQFNSTLEPIHELYNAEKEREQALNNFTSNPSAENDNIFQIKKVAYDELNTRFQSGYFDKKNETPETLVAPFVGKGALTGMNADESLKFIAEQAQNVNGGEVSDIKGGYEGSVNTFGEPLVKAAIDKHPLESLLTKKDNTVPVGSEPSTVSKVVEGDNSPNENIISVNDVIDKQGIYQGQTGNFSLDGKTVIFKVDGKNKEYELGNIDEVGNQSIKDFSIEQNNSVVSANESGNIVVRDKEYINNFSDPLQAINRDSEGNVVSVNLETADGKKVTFRNNIAEDVAYQIHLKEITKDNETRQKFEDFINTDEAARKEINDAEIPAVTEEATGKNNEPVQQREKIDAVKNNEVIPDNIYEDFIDSGNIPDDVLNNIAEKIKNQEKLTERENVIFQDKAGQINKILLDKQQESKSGLPFNKDKKDEYVTKSGRQKVSLQDGELVVKDTETGDDVSRQTRKKALREYADNFDFTHGKEVTETPSDTVTDEDAKKYIVDNTENPYQVTEVYVNEEPQTQSISAKEQVIADYGVQIHESSFNRFSDKNKLTRQIRKSYLVLDKNIDTPAKRSALGIDTLAKEISDYTGLDISPQDIVDFIDKFPGGEKDALKLSESDISVLAKERFKELTGLELTHELAEKVINQKFDLLNKEQQKLIEKSYENEQQLTDEYWKQYEETNGFTKESVGSETKQTEATSNAEAVNKKTNKGNEPPPDNPIVEDAQIPDNSNDGIGISKQAIFDKYGVKFEKTRIGWNEVTKDSIESLRVDAERKNTSVEQEAQFQVDKMATELKENRLAVSEQRIATVALHLMNTEELIDNLQNQVAETPQERATLATALDFAQAERDNTLKLIDALGSKSGRSLGLFAGFFSKVNDGGVTVARRRIEGTLGVELPLSEKELDANEKMSPWQKERIRPFVKKIEEIKNEYDEKIKELENKKSSSEKKERKKAGDSIRSFADKIRNSESLDKLGLGKPISGDTKGFSLNVKEHLADALEFIAEGIDKGEELAKLILEAAGKFRGKNDETEFKNLIDLAVGNLPPIDKNIVGKIVPFDVKTDIIEEQTEVIRRSTIGKLNQLSREAEDVNKTWYSKVLDWRRSFLIGGIKTLGRVALSGVSKFVVDPIAKQTTGRLTSLLPGLGKESASLLNAGEGIGSLIRFKDNKSALEYISLQQKKLELAAANLSKSNAHLSSLETKYGKSSNEYQKYEFTEHTKIEQEYQQAELTNAKASIYKWINGNGFKDAKDLVRFGSTDFEQSMGGYGKINPETLSRGDKVLYYVEAINRLHAVLKNPSARRSLVETYNAKLEHYQKTGVPLVASTRMRALDMAYGEFLSGKYQEKTQLTDYVNLRKSEGDKPNATGVQKIISGFLKIGLPVAKVPVNIVKAGVDMSTIGVEGIVRYMYEVNKGIKLNKEQGLEFKNVFDKISAGAEAMPDADKTYINKVLSRGLFGLGLMLYAGYGVSHGSIQYGGEYDKDHKAKRKYKGLDGKWHELDYGEWIINGNHMGKFGSSILNHLPEFLPVAMVVNTHDVYQYEHEYKGSAGRRTLKDSQDSYWEALKSDVNEISERLPYKNLLEPLQLVKSLASIQITKDIAEFFDKDKNGDLIKRKPDGIIQQLEMNTGLRKLVPIKK